jgi:hypothetical protein
MNLVKLRIAAFMPQHGAPTHMMASFQQVAFAVNAGGLFLELSTADKMNTILISNQTVIQRTIPLLRQIKTKTIPKVTRLPFQCNHSDVNTFLHQFSVSDDTTMAP